MTTPNGSPMEQQAGRPERSLLAQPLELRGVRLRNRLVATAHGIAAVDDGMPNETDAAYWSRLSRSGPAMIITGGVQVSKNATLRSRYLGEAWHDWSAAGFRKRADAIAAGGALAVVQLGHLGRETLGAQTFFPFEAPSAVRGPREPVAAHVLTETEIRGVVRAFARSAANMVAAGYGGVEIHGAHGYLIAEFLSRVVNDRADRYGGDVVGRATMLLETIEAIRAAVPEETVLGVRFSVENDPGGLSVTDIAEVCEVMQARAPVDYVNVSFGVRGYYVRDMATTRPPLLGQTRALSDALDVPLLVSCSFRTRADIESVLRDGGATLVGAARPYMADHEFARKLLDGRDGEIRPCVSCNEDCRTFDPTAMCSVNPDLAPPGAERRPAEPTLLHVSRTPPGRSDRVAVVGGGPGGMECALSLVRTGDVEVTLFERDDRLGGQLALALRAEGRGGWAQLIDYYRRQLADAGVEVRLGSPIEDARTLAGFDAVVWAVGATEVASGPDLAMPTVTTTEYLLDAPPAEAPIVIDDGFGWWPAVGLVETALARGASSVTFLTPGSGFAGGVPPESRLQLMERLRGRPVRVIVHASVLASGTDTLTIAHNGSDVSEVIRGDLVVRTGVRTARPIPHLDGQTSLAIGDCVMPRRVSHAIAEGRAAGLRLVCSPTPAV